MRRHAAPRPLTTTDYPALLQANQFLFALPSGAPTARLAGLHLWAAPAGEVNANEMRSQRSNQEGGEPAAPRAPRPGLSALVALGMTAVLAFIAVVGLRAASPHVHSLLREAYSALETDDSEGTGNASIWHRQRALALRVNPLALGMSVRALERAQQAAGLDDVEDADAEFLGDALVSAEDYDEDGEDEAGKLQPTQSQHRSISQLPRRPGGSLTSQRPKFPAHRGQSGTSEHRVAAFSLRKHRRRGPAEDPQSGIAVARTPSLGPRQRGRQAWSQPPPAMAQPVPAVESLRKGKTGGTAAPPGAPQSSDPAAALMRGGYAIDFVEQNGQHYGYLDNNGPVKVWESPSWKLRKNPKWQQPPNVCPGSPEKPNLKDGAPKKGRQRVMEGIKNMADGFYREEMPNGTVRLVQNRCMFFTKDCADLKLSYGGPQAQKKLQLSDEAFESLRLSKLMDLKPRMLGSCAIVANGENLLRGGRGADIDAHDTIFRHNTPVKGYEKAVGKRPSSVMWVKSKYEKNKQNKNSGSAEFMYDLLLGVDSVPKSFQHKGKGLLIVNKMGGYNRMARERFLWYKLAGAGSKNHPSGGFSRPLTLLASGLCTRVDLYGFSSRPSGKYFQKSFTVLPTHMMKFEHWVYRYMQSLGKVCVYGS